MKPLVEEVVRWDCPVQSFFRNTLAEVTVAGVTSRRTSRCSSRFGSANRDERHFQDPDTFRIDRGGTDHLGYGAGIHFCLGAPLARAQMNALWKTMAERCKGFTLDGKVERTSSVLFHGARILPIRLDPA